MFKKVAKRISLILFPIVITFASVILYDKYLDRKINELYNPNLARTYGVDEMNKGVKLLDLCAGKDDLIMLGSSELDSQVLTSPRNMFPNTQLNCSVDLVGRAYVQDLANAVRLGALGDSFSGKKIVLIISLQWFLGDDINVNGFKAHFSELQFYKFMNNKKISFQDKAYVCQRINKLLKNDSAFERPYLYASLYKNDNFLSKLVFLGFKPYYYLREKFLELKDKHQALKAVKRFSDQSTSPAVEIDWDKEEIEAQKMAEEECTNNSFNVYNEYYDTYLKDRMDVLKDSVSSDLDLCKSPEFEDYKLMLKTFKESNVKPYIVFMSTNGLYYDYIGLNQSKRLAFYDKLGSMAKEYGFDYLDLREKEYEPYFYRDVMHLGWKGWLYVNKKITEYYS